MRRPISINASTGVICRWWRQIAFFIPSGKLILDELMIGAVSSWLVEYKNNFTTLSLYSFFFLQMFVKSTVQAIPEFFWLAKFWVEKFLFSQLMTKRV